MTSVMTGLTVGVTRRVTTPDLKRQYLVHRLYSILVGIWGTSGTGENWGRRHPSILTQR